jgi:hypothetical protein
MKTTGRGAPSETSATTRSADCRRREWPPLLEVGQVITSPASGLRFRVERLIGAGGFGEVDLSHRIGRSSTVPDAVCLKISPHIDGTQADDGLGNWVVW